MSPQAQALVEQLGALSPEELDAVWAATLTDAGLTPAWADELRRRRAAVASGQMSTLSRAQADAELQERMAAFRQSTLQV